MFFGDKKSKKLFKYFSSLEKYLSETVGVIYYWDYSHELLRIYLLYLLIDKQLIHVESLSS